MIKGFRQIAVLTVISRILGMVRDMLFAAFLGRSGLMDLWVIAFKIPNLSRRIFGEGALSSSLMPVYMQERQTDPERALRLGRTVITVLVTGLCGLVLLGMIVLTMTQGVWGTLTTTQLMLTLTTVMLPYMILICLVAAVAGLLQAHRHFIMPALAPVVLNVMLIAALVISGWALRWDPARQLGFVAVAVLVTGVLQLALQLPALAHHEIRLQPCWEVSSEPFRRVMWLMGPMVLGLTVTQFNTLADDVIARIFSGSWDKGGFFTVWGHSFKYPLWAGAVSSLFYAQRLYQFPLGVFGISLGTAIFPIMNQAAAQGDTEALARTINQGIKAALFVALPATVGMLIISTPLVATIFQAGRFTSQDSPIVAYTLCFYVLGLSGYFLQQLVSRAYFSLQDSKTPFYSALLAMSVNIGLNLILIWVLNTGGLALATAICSYLQVWILARGLKGRLGHSIATGLIRVLGQTGMATLTMGVAGWLLLWLMGSLPLTRSWQTLRLLVVVPLAVAVYLGAARAMGMEQVYLIFGRRRK